jgi:hypothetical protein
VEERLPEFEAELRPEGPAQRALVRAVAAATVRIERCRREEEQWRDHRAQRAASHWDHDRQAEAREQAAMLPLKPALTLRKLRQTLQGAQWLRQAWTDLAARVSGTAGQPPRPLDDQGRQRAFDLLGLGPEQRLRATPLDLPAGSDRADLGEAALAAHQAALVTAQVAELDRLTSERYIALDQANRLEAQRGNFPGIDHRTRLNRRYESEAAGQRDRALEELRCLQKKGA